MKQSSLFMSVAVYCMALMMLNADDRIEYSDEVPTEYYRGEKRMLIISELAQKHIETTNSAITNVMLISWCVKRDNHLPPDLQEEILFTYKEVFSSSNRWVIACLESSFEVCDSKKTWTTGGHNGVLWNTILDKQPALRDIKEFIPKTNFGKNEYAHSTPIYTIVWKPYKDIIGVLKKGISEQEKRRRLDLNIIQ